MDKLEREQKTTETIVMGIDGDIKVASEEQFQESARLTEWTKTLQEDIKKREKSEANILKQHKSILDEANKVAMGLKRRDFTVPQEKVAGQIEEQKADNTSSAASNTKYAEAKSDLRAMGFSDEAAIEALDKNDGNLERATTFLLDKALEDKEKARLEEELRRGQELNERRTRLSMTLRQTSPTLRTSSM